MEKVDNLDRGEEEIAALLRAAGPRAELPDGLRQQMEQRFRAELQPVLEQRKRGRRRVLMALCAGLAAIGISLSLVLVPPAAEEIDIRVAHISGGNQLLVSDAEMPSPGVGQRLSAQSIITTAADGYLAIDYGSHQIRLDSDSQLAFRAGFIELLAGRLYVTDEDTDINDTGVRIVTAHGTVTDIGTQFTVRLHPEHTVTAVRRGVVVVKTGTTELRAEAQPGFASKVIFDRERHIEASTTAVDGPDWEWIYRSRPAFELEGKSAYDFLQWSVNETGLQLVFASESAEISARITVLHGDISELDPARAIQPVLATTDLRAERQADNRLLVGIRRH